LWSQYGPDAMMIGTMIEDNSYNQPDQQDLTSWNNQFNLTHPMLADGQGSQGPYVEIGYPTYVVIDRSMTIVDDDMWPFSISYVAGLL
jgi:hypothetical protein